MRKFMTLVGLGLLVALATGADGGGCGGGGSSDDPDTGTNTNPDGGVVANYPKTCTGDSDCLASEVCHPIGLVCVKNCKDDATVCGDDFCVETTFGGKTASVCKCETCAASGEVCSKDLDDVCETKCTKDDDCKAFVGQNRTCEIATGICKVQAAGACDPACTGNQVCDENGAIPLCVDRCTATSCATSAASKCNSTSGLCEACAQDLDCANVGANYKCDTAATPHKCVSTATTCDPNVQAPGNNKGPDTCNYAEVCAPSTNTCSATLPDGTCVDGYSWNKALFGPVIISVTGQSSQTSNSTNECGNGGPKIQVDVEFYAPEGLSYASFKDFLDPKACGTVNPNPCLGHFPFTPNDGVASTATGASFIRNLPASGAKYGSFTAGLCTPNNTLTGRAVWIIDGNGAGGNPACL